MRHCRVSDEAAQARVPVPHKHKKGPTTMARIKTLFGNVPWLKRPRTHEGAPARHISPELQLRRSVLACMLWEDQFYEDGVEIAGRIAELVPKVAAEKVAVLA